MVLDGLEEGVNWRHPYLLLHVCACVMVCGVGEVGVNVMNHKQI